MAERVLLGLDVEVDENVVALLAEVEHPWECGAGIFGGVAEDVEEVEFVEPDSHENR